MREKEEDESDEKGVNAVGVHAFFIFSKTPEGKKPLLPGRAQRTDGDFYKERVYIYRMP